MVTGQAKEGLELALQAAHADYIAANPLSAECHRRRLARMPGGNTRTVLHYPPFPLTFTRGEGATLWSADGARYRDFLGEFTAGLYGHSDPRIRRSLADTLEQGISFGGSNLHEDRLAALLAERFPSLELLRFTNSGTEANLLAIATAVAVTRRRKVLVFKGAYHGSVFQFIGDGSPMNAPYEFLVGRYNDIQATRDLIKSSAEELAAIVVEPMLGAGGCIPARREFLALLREEASRAGAILIFDEVMTSRLAPGGLQALHQVYPDLTTFGKYLGGGMSFGAFGGRRAIMEHFDPARPDALMHAGTFNNNILSMAAGAVGLEEIFTPPAVRALNERGDELRRHLNEVCSERGVALQATGLGSLMTLHAMRGDIATPADLAAADPKVSELIFFDLLGAGFWTARRGFIVLSLPTTTADCEQLATALARIIDKRATLLGAGGE
ncbi:MAG: aminotransferase class III-fold pyridoxal phosphate-dependent enzyme [Gammaproteobacteria bacterium]|nr:aminotransferase class III-fold pyridoxal phosphate-dependent enzyme [Gammaproteobacteria bacterium]